MDTIFIRGLRIETIIGVFAWERQTKQVLFFDLEIATDIKQAAASDQVGDALDYKRITKLIIQFVEKSRFQLIETLAEKIAALIMAKFDVAWLQLSINKKGALRHADDVGITIQRGVKSML